MNEKPNVPAEIFMCNKEYSWRADWTVNGWLFVATIISGLTDIMFAQVVREWPLGLRCAIVLAQFTAILLWARALTRWIRGMDEMHHRITVAAVTIALGATFFVLMLWHRLEAAGLFNAILPSLKSPEARWDICTLSHGFLLLTLFYCVSHSIFNRRFK